jgi:hypothetical protein
LGGSFQCSLEIQNPHRIVAARRCRLSRKITGEVSESGRGTKKKAAISGRRSTFDAIAELLAADSGSAHFAEAGFCLMRIALFLAR